MPAFGQRSLNQLYTCVPALIELLNDAVLRYDMRILQGARTPVDQAENVRKGVSKTLDSKHVVDAQRPLARAVDLEPYPASQLKAPVGLTSEQLRDFRAYVHEVGRFYHLAGYIRAKAEAAGVDLRWGGDWDSDGDFTDQTFDDLYHFELRDG